MALQVPPLLIGSIRVDPPGILASLAGYTDLPYRLLCRSLDATFCATEMMLDRQLLLPGRLRNRLVHTDPADHPVSGQIIGNDPAVMAKAAVELQKCGFDAVDMNFACPVRKVLQRHRGGYLMQDCDKTLEIIRAVTASVSIPVTVKIRMGFAATDVGSEHFWAIAEGGFDAGLAGLIIHARTVEQRYTGKADWEFLAKVKQHFADKVIVGSGDVTGPAAAERMLQETGVNGVSFARAALGNPWIFRQFADQLAGRPLYKPGLAEQRERLRRHFESVVELYGVRRGPKMMRKFGIKYARLHPTPGKVRAAFIGVRTGSQWRAILDEFYSDDFDASAITDAPGITTEDDVSEEE